MNKINQKIKNHQKEKKKIKAKDLIQKVIKKKNQ